jgi:hypothetical protein
MLILSPNKVFEENNDNNLDSFLNQNLKNKNDKESEKLDQSNLLFSRETAINLNKLETILGVAKEIVTVYRKNASSIFYNKEIESQVYNFFSFNLLRIFCSCSKRFSKKIYKLAKTHDYILEVLDIRSFIKKNFERDLVMNSIYNLDYSIVKRAIVNPSYNEQLGYDEFVNKS